MKNLAPRFIVSRVMIAVLACTAFSFAGSTGFGTIEGSAAATLGYFIQSSAASFVDITSTGTCALHGSDDDTVTASFGFGFGFLGESYGEAWISSNGLMGFGTPDSDSANVAMDSANLGAVIAPLWQDWQFFTPGTGGVYYATMGNPGSEEFIVEWSNAGSTNFLADLDVTFEAVLYQSSGDILFSYANLSTRNAGLSNGAAATVGISGGSAGQYLQYSYDQDDIASNSSLLIDPPMTQDGASVFGTNLVPIGAPTLGSSAAAPEPGSLLLLGSGMLALASAQRKKRNRAQQSQEND